MEKAFIAALTLLSLLSVGLTCTYDSEPYFENELPIMTSLIKWTCQTATMPLYTCLTTVTDGSDVIQVNPDRQIVKDVGVIDYFQSSGQIVQVYFKPEANIVRGGKEYNISVICSDGTTTESFNASVVPRYRELDRPFEIGVNIKENLPYLFGGFLVLSFLIRNALRSGNASCSVSVW